jgi:ketosteroid isomerase-like protein
VHEQLTHGGVVVALPDQGEQRRCFDVIDGAGGEPVAALYEEDAVMAYPPGDQTVGREAIRALWEKVLANRPRFEPEQPLPTLVSDDIALTSTPPTDGAGARAQVVRRRPDGSWLRLLHQPEFVPPTPGRVVRDRRPS